MSTIIIPILLALALCFVPRVKYVAQTLGTITHELGHAIIVMPFGGKLQGIKLCLNTEGEALVSIPRYPTPFYQILRILNLFAGYSAPIYYGLFILLSVVNNWTIALNILFIGMSVIVLLFIRNWFGLLIALLYAAMNVLFVFFLPNILNMYALTLAIVLLVRGVKDIYDAARWTFKNKLEKSDFTLAAEELGGTPQIWFVIFTVFHTTLLSVTLFLVFTLH